MLRTLRLIAIWLASLTATSARSCEPSQHLRALFDSCGLLMLCAARDHVAGADSVCAAVFGKTWDVDRARYLATRTPPEAVSEGLDWLCNVLAALPEYERNGVTSHLQEWVVSYRAIESLEFLAGVEAMAGAVAYVPSLSKLFPRNEATRAALGREVGGSLADGEVAGLQYRLAAELSRMSREARASSVRDLYVEALRNE